MKKLFLILFVIFSFNINVKAASICSYEEQTELNSKAANVKVTYEVVEEIIEFDDMEATREEFDISIFNITEDLYVKVTNNINNEERVFTVSDTTDGVATFRWSELESVTNFTIEVYTTDNTSCPDERYKTIYLTTPRYNIYSRYEVCSGLEDFYLCQKYVTFEDVEEDVFLNKLESYQTNINEDKKDDKPVKEEPTKTTDKIFEFLDNYKWYIAGGFLLIIVIIVIINRKRVKKQRDLGL